MGYVFGILGRNIGGFQRFSGLFVARRALLALKTKSVSWRISWLALPPNS